MTGIAEFQRNKPAPTVDQSGLQTSFVHKIHSCKGCPELLISIFLIPNIECYRYIIALYMLQVCISLIAYDARVCNVHVFFLGENGAYVLNIALFDQRFDDFQ